MAAVTPDRIEVGTQNGDRLIKGIFSTTTVDDGDTWATGLKGIKEVAWKATANTDEVCVTESATAGTLDFDAASTGYAGEVWIVGASY